MAPAKLKIAIIGQSLFGAEVYRLLRSLEHRIVGVFTVPDVKGRPDPLGELQKCVHQLATIVNEIRRQALKMLFCIAVV